MNEVNNLLEVWQCGNAAFYWKDEIFMFRHFAR